MLFPAGNFHPESLILESGFALVDKLRQERPGFKYGLICCYREGHILFEELPLEGKDERDSVLIETRVFVLRMAGLKLTFHQK